LPPSPVDENIGEEGGDIRVVRVERERPFEVDFGLVILLEQNSNCAKTP
jgi:hypothetical protein